MLDDQKINDEDKQEKLKGGQDGAPPFSAPDDVAQGGPSTNQYPTTDSDVDSDEEYNVGTSAASGQPSKHPDQDDQGVRIA